jgi:hypothetical protein
MQLNIILTDSLLLYLITYKSYTLKVKPDLAFST